MIVNKLVAENLCYTALVNNNYWSPLAEQVVDSESKEDYHIMNIEQQREMDPRWIKILEKRLARQAFIDSGATSGAAGEEDEGALINTGQS